MSDGIGLAETLLGLSGLRVLDVVETETEVVVWVESTATRAFCRTCGVQAEAQDRMRVDIRDLACFGRPARLVWSQRRWRCRERLCSARTWTEHSEHVDAQAVLTRRAGIEAVPRWLSAAAGDAGLGQHRCRDTDLPPGVVADSLPFTVGLGDLDERRLQRVDVHRLLHRTERGLQIAAFLHQFQFPQRIGGGQFVVDGGQATLDRLTAARPTAPRLPGP